MPRRYSRSSPRPGCGATIGGMTGIEATAELEMAAPPERVWQILTDNDLFGEVMFGSEIVTDWTVGSPILFRGVWKGTPFEDKGEILELDPPKRFVHTHWSPMSGVPDTPEHAQRVTWTLEPSGGGTTLTVEEENLPSDQAKAISDKSWPQALEALRALLET